ncbi:MAG: hypothetical protein IK002_04660 [Treponema sp.]|uniref:hypothetical protein n=1 Tax=Treponema sp. TaxID=166 RepID=UPI00298E4BE2|nr:hypothetical protein [Treponema sp.]MBR5933260.1 hypothetical protein [Treponema sp.]
MNVFKKIALILIFSLFSSVVFAAGRGGQDLILCDSWIYDALLSIEMEMGRTTFSDQAPVSINELKTYLDDIDYESLSEPGKKQYERIQNYLKEKNWSWNYGIFSIGVEPSSDVEFYYKSEEDTPWVYDYTKRGSMIDCPIKLGVGDYFTVYMGLTMSQSYTARFSNDNYVNQFFVNDAFDPALVHENYISTGYIWDNNVGFNFRLGSGTQSIGHSLMPSIIMSEYMTDTPYANFRIFSPIFNYNFNVTQFTRSTYLYTHRIETRFFKKIQFSFIEGVLPYDHFDLRFVNPFAIFHGYGLFNEFDTECSSYFGFKINFIPVKYLRIYALYSQNEHSLASEDGSEPEGTGFQVGAETYLPFKSGYFHFGAEFYYTNPYLFIKQSPNVSFARVFTEMIEGTGNYYQWMGNPFGPDSLAFQIAAGYEVPDKWSVDLAYSFAALGEFSGTGIFSEAKWQKSDLSFDETNWPYNLTDKTSLNAPHGTVEYHNSITLKAAYKPLNYLTIMLQPSYVIISNFGHKTGETRHGVEFALGIKTEFTKISHRELSSEALFKDGKEK